MRTPILTSMTVLALLAPAMAGAQQNPERAAIQQVITSFADAIHTNQLGNVDALFAPTGIHIIVDDAALHGWAEYRDGYLMPEMVRYPQLRYAHTGLETSVRGNVAWVAFRWQMSTSGDAPAPVLGRASAVLEKIGDRWLITHLHVSR
jgi:ketosteroid isomerase-like protein